jgi:hypothetical protein
MSRTCFVRWVWFLLIAGLIECQRGTPMTVPPLSYGQAPVPSDSFLGSRGGDEREIGGVKFCWCPPGRFRMGGLADGPD